MDKFKNIFYYFRGPQKDYLNNKQIENNTTKAFINTIEHLDSDDLKRRYISFITECELFKANKDLKFSLQTIPINTNSIKNKFILILLPPDNYFEDIIKSDNLKDSTYKVIDRKGRPDGWIYDDQNVFLIETKSNLKVYEESQILGHLNNPIINWRQEDFTRKEIKFNDIHRRTKDFYSDNRTEIENNELNSFLFYQFIKYLEEINMTDFEGFKQEHFFSLMAIDDKDELGISDSLYDTKFLKQYFDKFTKTLQEKLLSTKFKLKNDPYIYPFDSTKKTFYNHFCPAESNDINMNVNTSFRSNHLSYNIWIPLYSGNISDKDLNAGKINRNLLFSKIEKYKENQIEFVKIFYGFFKNLKYTYEMTLYGSQYEHYVKSRKGPQRMQKKPSTEIIKIAIGSDKIIDKKNKLYILDETKNIYDNPKKPTKFVHSSFTQLEAFFKLMFYLLWNNNPEQENPLSEINKFQITIGKKLPSNLIISLNKNKLIDISHDIVLDLSKLIARINSL